MEETAPETPVPAETPAAKPFNKKRKRALKKGYRARFETSNDVIKVKYTPNEGQKKFADLIASGKKITICVGGRQGGKTYAGAREALKQIYKYKRRPFLGWIISPTYPMSNVVEREFEKAAGFFEDGGLIIKKMAGQRAYLLHPPAGETEPYRVEIKTAENPDRLRGAGLGWIWMDEAAMMSEEVYQILLGTILATKGIIFMTSTPRGHNWFYRLYCDSDKPEKRDAIGAVRWRSVDNIYLGEQEIALMKGQLSEDFARQELDAEFVSFDGLVYKGFHFNRHTIKPLIQLPPGAEVITGIDNGYGDPFACLWIAKYDGKFYVIDEFYEKGRTLDYVARSIKGKSWDRFVIRRWADPSGAQERAELDKFGISTYPARNDLFSGINCVERLFEQGRLFIAENCVNTLSEIGQYHYDIKNGRNTKEKPVDSFNHAMDALRYGIFSEAEYAMAHPLVTVKDDGSVYIDRGQGSYMTADLNEWIQAEGIQEQPYINNEAGY